MQETSVPTAPTAPTSHTPTPAAEITATPSPTQTDPPTPSATPAQPETAESLTPSATPPVLGLQPTATPYLILPGIYQTGGCAVTNLDDVTLVTFCVTSVEVTSNRNMIFNVTWQLKYTTNDREAKFWTKRSDRGNAHMYLLDNLGRRYDHLRGGGAAYTRQGVWGGDLHTGWFEFPPAPPGAITFYFYDDDLKQVIRNIPLLQPDVVFIEFPLVNRNLVLDFPQGEWNLLETSGEMVALAYEQIPECRLNEKAAAPEGKLLNTMNLGAANYQISSYLDPGSSAPRRDYQAIQVGETLEDLPVITLSLPAGDPQACIFAASKILASLSERQAAVIPTPVLITPSPTPSSSLESASETGSGQAPTPAGPPTQVQPGYYAVHRCGSGPVKKVEGARIELCILNILVAGDRSVHANVTLEVKHPYGMSWHKRSDQGNIELYLMDKNGKRYIQKAASNFFYQDSYIRNGRLFDGWFEFPSIAADAFELSFHNDRLHIVISKIVLREPVILTGVFPLANPLFALEYLHEDWELTESEGQPAFLRHKTIEGCSLQEDPDKEIQGKLKNTTVLGGSLVYKIFGYIDSAAKVGYRQYQFAGGLPIIDASTYPVFLVTIPLDQQQKCIFDASELLGNLTLQQDG